MTAAIPVVLSGVVEGPTDEAVLSRLVVEAGATLGSVSGKTGKNRLLQQLAGYNKAARFSPWVVLVDLDRDGECAPSCRVSWLPSPEPQMCFRIVVRAMEAWLLADRGQMAKFLSVSEVRIPSNPEEVNDPKRCLIDLARRSRKRQDMVPKLGSDRSVGPAYSQRLIQFAEGFWGPEVAARRSDSLRRCRQRLKELVEGQS